MFFFYAIIVVAILIILLIEFTTVQIHIQNLRFHTEKIDERNISPKYKIIVKLYIFNKINYLKINLTKNQLERRLIKKNVNKLKKKIKQDKNKFDKKILSNLKKTELKIKKIDLKIYLGISDAAINAIIVGIVSSSIAVIMGILMDKNILDSNCKCKKEENNQIYWKIIPVYQNKNLLNIDLNCIISFKLIHIIHRPMSSKKK